MDTITYNEWLDSTYWPLMGAEGEDDPVDPADPAAGGDPVDPADPVDPVDLEDPEANPADPDDPDAPEEIDRIREERDKVRRELAAAQVAIQKAKSEARKAREEAAKKGGNWEQVAKEREAELADANDRAQSAETRAIAAEDSLDSFQREVRVSRLATRLGFRDPGDAIKLLSNDVTGEDKVAERALRKLVEDKPYLVDQRRATGRGIGNGNGGTGLSLEQIKAMSQDEINARWAEVSPVLARTGGRASGG